jgi:TolB-like protein/DNA-binding winged helix-turn-helix (wHTH) protein/Flp pilus assembly protein TadD
LSASHVVRFGSFEFDFDTGELRRNGRRVPLQSQPTQLLAQLLSRPGQVVTREELRSAIWTEDTFVEFDTALNVAVNKIRQSLRDSASAPRFVETVPKRGYRFLADVHTIVPSDPAAVRSDPSLVPPDPAVIPVFPVATGPRVRASSSARLLPAALIVTIIVAAVWSGSRFGESATPMRSVAVLPFRPLVAEARDEALEVGLAEAVIIKLGQFKQLRVPSVYAVQRYAQLHADSRVAGRELGVESVLEGSLLRGNGNVRLSARLLDVATGSTLWAQQWDLPWSDIFTVQDALATHVSRALAVRLGGEGSPLRHPTNAEAYERFLRARYLLHRRTIADSKRAAELLEEAIELDPNSAAAHASVGFAYISVPLLEGPTKPFVELGRQAARRALDLDPTIAEAHAVLGRIMLHFDWDVEAGHREMRRAVELEPTNPFVLHCYARVLADDGRFEEAIALADRALAQDPTSVLATRDEALILFLAGRYEDCVEMCRRTLELDPYAPQVHYTLGRAYEELDRPREAVEAYITPLTFSEKNRGSVAALRAGAAQGGIKGFWEQRLQELLKEPEVRAYSVASAYMRLGDGDRALQWLEKHYAERGAWIRGLKVQPQWDPLRADPRFQDLLRRANMTAAPSLLSSRDKADR